VEQFRNSAEETGESILNPPLLVGSNSTVPEKNEYISIYQIIMKKTRKD
jgi:hypothetical protein